MDLKGIISISGMSGLYKVIAQTKNGFVVESFTDKKRTAITSSHKVSALEDISIFTTKDNIALSEALMKVKENEATLPDTKSDAKVLREYFKSVLPDYDEGKVYDSDIKKMLTWYSILKEYPECWVQKEEQKTEEQGDAEEKKAITIPKPGEKPHVILPKESGKVNTHGMGNTRSAIPQKRGGG